MKNALAATMMTLPEELRRTLTWDRGKELSQHAQFKIETGMQSTSPTPHSPWQRATNGLLRQYFPKGTDLSRCSVEEMLAVEAALNSRPRKTLEWKTPPRHSTSTNSCSTKVVLLPPVEPGQYASAQITEFADQNGITRSMELTGICWGNAMAESFFATLKTEFYYRLADPDPGQARGRGLDRWPLNRRRRHSSIGQISLWPSRCNTATSPRQTTKPHSPVSTNRGQGHTQGLASLGED